MTVKPKQETPASFKQYKITALTSNFLPTSLCLLLLLAAVEQRQSWGRAPQKMQLVQHAKWSGAVSSVHPPVCLRNKWLRRASPSYTTVSSLQQPAAKPSCQSWSVCSGSTLQVRCSPNRQESATGVLKNHTLFSAPASKVKTGGHLLINTSPSLWFDKKLRKKTQGKRVFKYWWESTEMTDIKPRTLIKGCSSDTHLEVNCHILIILFTW